jgi:hypothetical protein
MILPVPAASPAGHVTLLDAEAMASSGMTIGAMLDRPVIRQPLVVAPALPTLGLPAQIEIGGHSLRVFSVQLVDAQDMWRNNAICLPRQFASNGI